MNASAQSDIETVVRVLRECRSMLFVTGAGMSADSGVPTYRGIGGMYDIESTEEGLPIETILSGPMFRSNPELTWKYLGQIAAAASGATFNRGHEVIAEMERRFPRVWTLTQNVDGFHHLAGSENVIEIHGNMRSLFCTRCGFRRQVSESSALRVPPICEGCKSILRPDVVLFEEPLPSDAIDTLRRELSAGFGAVICIGTTGVFPYIQEPVLIARREGVPTIEINPGETILSHHVDYRLPMGAADALDAIWRGLEEGTG